MLDGIIGPEDGNLFVERRGTFFKIDARTFRKLHRCMGVCLCFYLEGDLYSNYK